MSNSYCKGCKVVKVGHETTRLDQKNWDRILESRTNSIRSENAPPINPLNFIVKWRCNNCYYISLRWEDGTQFHPVEPIGKDLDDKIPENIRKDFNEARKIGELSPRCGNVLLRTCLEGLCNWIAEEFLEGEEKAKYLRKTTLHGKIEDIKKHTTFVSDILFKTMEIIKAYGNDIHVYQKIEDSDTFESFKVMLRFIESIGNNIVTFIENREYANELHQKILQKTKT